MSIITTPNLMNDKLSARSLESEMKDSYLSYAMSVIVDRALPDVRDGLKPVHRRILYSMWTSGLRASAKFRKSAAVVGDVLAKYHPHGDTAVYDTMVRMAQDFSLRYPLIWGQGNFGSMDGDNAAAYRYTEAKLTHIAEEMLLDIEKDTVDFIPNFDGVHDEPTVLPAKLPNLLLNGTVGIAVGMATNIPPHNLTELIDGICHLVDNPDATVTDLMKFIKGPDFPTGAQIYDVKAIQQAYETGRGPILMRAPSEIIETKPGQFQIVFTEMTYATNKATLIEKIADLVREEKILGIKDVNDYSDKTGIRVAVDLKKDAFPQKVLNQLYAHTDLQKNFNVNMLALVDGVDPLVLNLKQILVHYLKHREQVLVRRTEYDLARAKDRAHILEGLKIALDHIDAVIRTIRESATKEEAHVNLMKKFKLSDKQATAILEMRLQTLAGLERKKIEDELAEKYKLIAYLEDLLKHRKKLMALLKTELMELKDKYGDDRRTKVIRAALGDFSDEDLIPDEEAILTLTVDGYVKRMRPDTYRTQRRGGKGVQGATAKEGDELGKVMSFTTHDNLFFFTDSGKVFQVKGYEIPESSRTAKGQAIVNFIQISPEEKITAVIPFNPEGANQYLFMATAQGTVKKCKAEDFGNVRRSGLIAINLDKGDTLGWVGVTSGKDEIIMTTKSGQAIRYNESDVRAMGRAASGVRGMKFDAGDAIVGMDVIHKDSDKKLTLTVLSEHGYGKKSPLTQYKVQKRGGSGIKTMQLTDKTGPLVTAIVTSEDDMESDMLITSHKGIIIRVPFNSVPQLSRATQGVRIMRPQAGDRVGAFTLL